MLFNIKMSSGEKDETTKNKQDEMSERVRKIIQRIYRDMKRPGNTKI